jgi:hypothetical protein
LAPIWALNLTPITEVSLSGLSTVLIHLKSELCYIAAITYGIWFARNKMVFENLELEDKLVIEMATTTIRDYQIANIQNKDYNNGEHRSYNNGGDNRRTSNRIVQRRNQKWKKPRSGSIKANCDANLAIDGSWGLGAIFRDEEGHVVASATWVRAGFNDPTTAEAYALYLTTRLAADCCFINVEFESDCLNVVKSVNSLSPSPRNYLGNLIRGIHLNLARFRHCSFHFEKNSSHPPWFFFPPQVSVFTLTKN